MKQDYKKLNDIDLKSAKVYTKWNEAKRWIPSIIILLISIYWFFNRGSYGLMDNIDLVIHEAGHLFFSLFGKFIYTLGGTLMQIIIPGIIVVFFFRNQYRTGVQFALLWLGQNFINISIYAADARLQRIPLLGGNKVYHDWNYILNTLGLLNYDITIGYIFLAIAIITFIIAVLMPLITQD